MKKFNRADVINGMIAADLEDLKFAPLTWQKLGLAETSTGYGAKLTTRYKISFCNRLYRVYATCFSNCASNWIKVGNGKEKIFIF